MAVDPWKAAKAAGMAGKLLYKLCDSGYVCAACGQKQVALLKGATLLGCCGREQCPACVARGKSAGRCSACGCPTYDQNQYLPLVLTCADNDQFVMLSLRHGSAHAALGADDDVAYLVTRLRQVWPDVVLHFRGDCGFGVPGMYEACEGLRVTYTFGLSTNAVLQGETEGLLAEAVAGYERERQAARQQEPPRPAVPSRLFTGFWYQAGTWPQPRWVVAKAEATDRGTNRRFVVTNRPGAMVLPGPTYDEYAGRGESDITHAHYTSSERWCGDPDSGYNPCVGVA
jgi:hypothetical protein